MYYKKYIWWNKKKLFFPIQKHHKNLINSQTRNINNLHDNKLKLTVVPLATFKLLLRSRFPNLGTCNITLRTCNITWRFRPDCDVKKIKLILKVRRESVFKTVARNDRVRAFSRLELQSKIICRASRNGDNWRKLTHFLCQY